MAGDATVKSGRVGGAWRLALLALGAVGGLIVLGGICYSLGLEAGRDRAAGGFLSGLTGTVHGFVGLLATIPVVIVAPVLLLRRGSARTLARAVGWLLVAAIAVGWASWWAGNSTAFAEGPSVSYVGSVTLEFTGPLEATATYAAECESVIGDPDTLRNIDVREASEAGESFSVHLRPGSYGADRMTLMPSFSASSWTVERTGLSDVGYNVDPGSMTVIEHGFSGTMTFTDNPHAVDLDLGFPQVSPQLHGLHVSVSWECSRSGDL